MALRIIVAGIGRRDAALEPAAREWQRLIRPYAAVDVVHVRAPGRQDGSAAALAAEGEALSRAWPAGAYGVALSPDGRAMDSVAFAAWLDERRREAKPLVFFIGGAYGLDAELKRGCRLLLSLSAMTLSHRIALLVLLEQLYRGHTILAGHPYHK